MGKPRKSRVDATGRNSGKVASEDRVLIVRRSLWHSPHVSALPPSARALLIELLSMFNGANNGVLFLSIRDATQRLGVSDYNVAMKAFDDLMAVKLVTLTVSGHFAIKAGEVSRAQAWRLNFVDGGGKPKSADALPALNPASLPAKMRARMDKRQTALKRYLKERQQGRFSVEEIATLGARSVEENATLGSGSVEEIATVDERLRSASNPPMVVEEIATHIEHHSLGERTRPGSDGPGWWVADRLHVPTAAFIAVLTAEIESNTSNVVPLINRTPCEFCGEPFERGTRGKPKRFCCEVCRKQAERSRARERRIQA